MDVGLRELRQQASELVRRAEGGETVVVTRQRPPRRTARAGRAQHVAALVAPARAGGAAVRPAPLGEQVARSYGQLAAAVVAAGRQPRARVMDLLVAATAHAHDARLYTSNPQDLRGLEDLLEVVAVWVVARARIPGGKGQAGSGVW